MNARFKPKVGTPVAVQLQAHPQEAKRECWLLVTANEISFLGDADLMSIPLGIRFSEFLTFLSLAQYKIYMNGTSRQINQLPCSFIEQNELFQLEYRRYSIGSATCFGQLWILPRNLIWNNIMNSHYRRIKRYILFLTKSWKPWLKPLYEGSPESIQPFWISREPITWHRYNLSAS